MTPLERAARALQDEIGGNFHETVDDELAAHLFRQGARAVLTAIREPSEGMLVAGERGGFGDPYYGGDQLADSYRSMIDAALSEGG